jgi:serine/threonine-protein kinase
VTPSAIQIVSSDYIGRKYQDVVAELKGKGLDARAVAGTAATSESKVDTVSKVDPTGPLHRGDGIDVTYYTATATPPKPTAAPSVQGPTPVPGDADITVSWPKYTSCPTGTDLSSYSVSIDGSSNPVGDKPAVMQNSIQLHTGPAGSGKITVKYKAFCGLKDSAYSDSVTIPIAAGEPATTPATTPTPTPTPTP